MKKLSIIPCLLAMFLAPLLSQEATWIYAPDWNIRFSEADSLNNPFECTTDDAGNIWVISSTSTTLNAVNALYKAAPGDSVFTLADDFSDDPDVHSVRGVATVGNNVIVACRSTQLYISFMYQYPDGDPTRRTLHNQVGYGTYVYGIDATKEGYIFGGIIFQGPKIRIYDYTGNSDPIGHYVAPDCANPDPGGPTATGEDAIRDVATVPGGDYFDVNTPVYTSRNSLKDGNSGGVTKWTGGTQVAPENYSGVSLEDADSFLRWTNYVPNGITVDNDGQLWAVGTDSTRRWVKVFQVDGSWATQVNELPSSTSGDIPDTQGAPLNVPEDVALSPDGNIAYVIDVGNHICYTFVNSALAIDREGASIAADFSVTPAFPNPFNPTTQIAFTLPAASSVSIKIFDLKGNLVRNVLDEHKSAGSYQVTIDAADLGSGIYIYMVDTSYGTRKGRITLLK